MTIPEPQDIWREQCEAAREIKERYGLNAARDYLISEKLLNHANAALRHPEFARALPGFVAEVRGLFEPSEIAAHLEKIERRDREQAIDDFGEDEDDPLVETTAEAATRRERFALIKELLLQSRLGTA